MKPRRSGSKSAFDGRETRHLLRNLLSGFSFVRRLPDFTRNPTYFARIAPVIYPLQTYLP